MKKKATKEKGGVLSRYVDDYPSAQVAVDIFDGEWTSRFPAGTEVRAGTTPLFEDPRISWAMSVIGSPKDKTVLELGFLEGGHTYMLSQMGARQIDAIDANTHAYLKALIAKEILGMQNAKFYCGDFTKYLAKRENKYDILLCSGVLYHMTNPVQLLADMAACSDNLFIWTHYYDAEYIVPSKDNAKHFSLKKHTCSADGFSAETYHRNYKDSLGWRGFCGGPEEYSCWMERKDIVACLEHFGFTHFEYSFEEQVHESGPAFAMVAQRKK